MIKTKLYLTAALLVLAALVCSVGAVPYYDYTMKYAQVTPDMGDGCGRLYIHTLCFNNVFSKDVVIQRLELKDNTTAPIITNGVVAKEAFNFYNPLGENQTIQMEGAGNYDGNLAPGIYGLTLLDGNSGDPEYAIVQIEQGYKVQVNFVGHAISPKEDKVVTPKPTEVPTEVPTAIPTETPTESPTVEPTQNPTPVPTDSPTPIPTITIIPTESPTPVPTVTIIPTESPTPIPTVEPSVLLITHATYGATIEVPGTPEIPAVTHTEYKYIISPKIDAKAEVDSDWMRVYPIGATIIATQTIPAVTHTVHHAASYTYTIVKRGSFTGYCDPVYGSGKYDFVIGGQKYRITFDTWDQRYLRTGNDAWDEIVIDAPAYNEYKYVISPATPEVPEVDSDWVLTVPSGMTIIDTKVVIDVPEVPAVPGSTVDHYIDVTGIVQGLVSGGTLHITADYSHLHYDALFTDPIVGTVKTLKVDYTLDGIPGSVSVNEMTDINIP